MPLSSKPDFSQLRQSMRVAMQPVTLGQWSVPWAGAMLASVALYIGFAELGLLLATLHDNVSPVWPATGFAISLLLLGGRRLWPAIFLGALVANGLTAIPWTAVFLIAVGNTLEALLGESLVRAIDRRRERLGFAADSAGIALGALLGPVVSATIGVAALRVTGVVSSYGAGALWKTWWIGDALGALVVVPTLLAMAGLSVRDATWSAEKSGKVVLILFGAVSIGWAVFVARLGAEWLFLVFPLLLLALSWFGSPGVNFASAGICALSILAATLGMGPFTTGTLNNDLVHLQIFLTSVAVVALVLPSFRASGSLFLPGLVLLAGWALSGWMFAMLHYERRDADSRHFAELAQDCGRNIEQRLTTYSDALRGGASMFAASEHVSRDQWRTYAHSLQLRQRYPGVLGIGAVFPVRADALPSFLERIRADGAPQFSVHDVPDIVRAPDGPRGREHFLITYIEPTALNAAAIGLDLASESNRRVAAEAARDQGEPQLTGNITLVQDGEKGPGFLLFVPVYRSGLRLGTVSERRAAFLGWVYAPFMTRKFFEGGLGHLRREIDLHCFQLGASNALSFVYSSTAARSSASGRAYELVSMLQLGGQRFVIGWDRSREFVAASYTAPVVAGACSAVISLLLAGLVVSLQTTGRRANAIAEARTAELRATNQVLLENVAERQRVEEQLRQTGALQRAILESANCTIISTTPDGVIQTFNPAAVRLLGYFPDEVIGNATPALIHDPDEVMARAEQLSVELGRAIEPGFEVFIARAQLGVPDEREWTYVRKDGSRFPVLLSVTALFDEAGYVTGYVGVGLDITERRRAQEQLQQAKDLAESASRAKSDFLATMSHEIRTPMNGVLGFAEMLMDSPLNPEQREWLRIIQSSGESLLALINDILDFSKIEAGKLSVENVAFSPAVAASEVVAVLSARAAAKGLQLRLNQTPSFPSKTFGDPARFKQLLLNLAGNAIKFTSQGSVQIQLSWSSDLADEMFGVLRAAVVDTGLGVAPDKQALLFQKFSQADTTTTRKFGGSGLGLAICKRLVELQGGEIGLDSVPGQGSTFWFTLPLNVAPESEVAQGHTEFLHRTHSSNPASETPKPSDTDRGVPPVSSPRIRVLLAEHLLVNQTLAIVLLGKIGCQVEVARNGLEAVAKASGGGYDLILMDCQMPEMDGFEAAREIRRLNIQRPVRGRGINGGPVPIIAVTANALLGDREQCRAAGMDDYISKPFKPAELKRVIESWSASSPTVSP